jgi:hypothetical protein
MCVLGVLQNYIFERVIFVMENIVLNYCGDTFFYCIEYIFVVEFIYLGYCCVISW